MPSLIQQLEQLQRTSDLRHSATMARLATIRSEHRRDYGEMREGARLLTESVAQLQEAVARFQTTVIRLETDVRRVDLRSQSQMEGLEAALRSDLEKNQEELTMLYAIVKSHLESELQKSERKDDEIQSCINKIRSLELRMQELESRQQPPAA
jgi:predicted  nucleic acid-binding Zn-ribbon protein